MHWLDDCPEALGGRHGGMDRLGRCHWCGRKIGDKQPRPTRWASGPDDLDSAYRRMWDPDWGAGRYDVDPAGPGRAQSV